ncbi:hypothetical protein V8B97DRAFT_1916050 [Scleroderma yunnanense]
MSAIIRSLATFRAFPVQPSSRAFHSPFVALKAAGTPLSSQPTSSVASPVNSTLPTYEKQVDNPTSEPHITSSGTRTYVVSEPDPSKKAYEVPYGAYSTNASYGNLASTDTPKYTESKYGSNAFSHPYSGRGRAVPRI